MKYEFIEKSLDEYELHYTNKDGEEIIKPFKRTIEIASKLQSANKDARMEFFTYLTSIGKTKDDLIIKRQEDDKIIYDETNYRELESSFINDKALEIAFDLYKKLFGMDFVDLVIDMGVSQNDVEQWNKFNTELHDLLVNGKVKTPSNKEKKDK